MNFKVFISMKDTHIEARLSDMTRYYYYGYYYRAPALGGLDMLVNV
jgi:hypothetical protein